MRTITISLSALALSAGMAHAGGMVVPQEPMVTAPAPMMARAYDWTGGYAGLGLTYGRATHNADAAAPNVLGFPVNDFWPNGSGLGIGGFVGFNMQNGDMVYGVEGHLSGHRMRGDTTLAGVGDIRTDLRGLASLRGRVGVAADRTLFFVTAGPAAGSVRHTATLPNAVLQETNTVTGFMIGAGVEHALAGGWHIRGDLEHYRFGSKNFDTAGAGTFPSVRTRANLARVSAVFRF